MFEVNLSLWYYIISKTQILGGNKMENLPNCPKCNSEYTYEDGSLVVCPECGYEWNPNTQEEENVIKDVNGNVLNDGDSVTVVKDLKVKGASSSIKIGTKVKNIRLVPDAADGHDIECKIDGFGAMKLKSSVVKKA
ncbi:putative alkylphosphonate utilization operon protein PhnA [Intestinibacter bartlettii DSM 16795]|nr:putative alkylphosphonate utilization operon protein PhnA [Intestinibacter bartlettii DSM 16795]